VLGRPPPNAGSDRSFGWLAGLGSRGQGTSPVVSDARLVTFAKRVVRPNLDALPSELSSEHIRDIKKALRSIARSKAVTYRPSRALDLLRRGTGIADANFRSGQEEAIHHVVDGRGRLLVVEKTGWGKSFVYFIATRLLREAGRGPAVLVSPLLSLMRNQILAAARMGVRAARITSDNTDAWPDVEAALDRDEVDILEPKPEEHCAGGATEDGERW